MKKTIIQSMCIIVMIIYLFNDLFETIGIRDIRYLFSMFALLGGGLLIAYKGKIKQKLWPFYIFIIWGVVWIIISLFSKGIVSVIMGFISVYFNLVIWVVCCLATDNWKDFYEKYTKIYVYSMVANCCLAVYQYFVDASLFGLATHKLYGSESSYENLNIARRVTALMGSPQNFAVAAGVALLLAYDLYKRKKCSWIWAGIIFLGGCFSGARTFGIFAIVFVVQVLWELKDKMNIRKVYIILGAFILLAVGIAVAAYTGLFSLEVFTRVIDFSRWAALDVYFESFKDITLPQILFGSGYGLVGWGTSLGGFSFDYSSVESHIVALFQQGGIVIILFFMFIFLCAMMKIQRGNRRSYFMLICIVINIFTTPAFSGLAISFLFWPMIISYYFKQEE